MSLETPAVEMNTLYNNHSKPYLQTFKFAKVCFMIGFPHSEKTNESMANRINWLQKHLGMEMFSKLFPLLLADRGT